MADSMTDSVYQTCTAEFSETSDLLKCISDANQAVRFGTRRDRSKRFRRH